MAKPREPARSRTPRRPAMANPPQQDRAIRTRAVIVEHAADEFADRGYEAASLNAIVRASGLTKGAFYFHFPSKEALALAVFRAKQAQLVERLKGVAAEQPDALQALVALIRTRAELLQTDPSLRCFLGLASELVAHFGPGSEFAASYNTPIDTFTALVRQGQQQGVIRPTLEPRSTAETLFAALLGTDEMSKVIAAGRDLVYRTNRWLEVMLAGIAAEPPPTKQQRNQTPHGRPHHELRPTDR